MTLRSFSANGLYRRACEAIIKDGKDVEARGLKTRELVDVELMLENPADRLIDVRERSADMRYFVGELCYFLDGRTDLASIAHYSKFWEKVSDDGKTVNSAYGYRLFDEHNNTGWSPFTYALNCLRADVSSRKAVMPIYDRHDSKESRDNPCTMFLQFLIRDNALSYHVFMRSNDVWFGLTYDLMFFTLVQEIASVALRKIYPSLKLGAYHHHAVSLHTYEKDYCKVNEVARHGAIFSMSKTPSITSIDIDSWFDDLLTYEKSLRGKVLYKQESHRTEFQTWAKQQLLK